MSNMSYMSYGSGFRVDAEVFRWRHLGAAAFLFSSSMWWLMESKDYKVRPSIHPSCFVAEGAVVVGDVLLKKGVSVWFNAVIRGDVNRVQVGENSNVQDCCVIHVSEAHGVLIGKNVSIGHGAIVHGATIEDDVIVGMNSCVLDGAVVGSGSIIGAGAVVTPGTTIPPSSLVVGIPGKVVKENDPKVAEAARMNGVVYQKIRDAHLGGRYPPVIR